MRDRAQLYAAAVREIEVALGADTLQPDDVTKLREILRVESVDDLLGLIHAYYDDRARADRTPRALLYVHLGIVMGLLDKVTRGEKFGDA